jgi:hypothetical protein
LSVEAVGRNSTGYARPLPSKLALSALVAAALALNTDERSSWTKSAANAGVLAVKAEKSSAIAESRILFTRSFLWGGTKSVYYIHVGERRATKGRTHDDCPEESISRTEAFFGPPYVHEALIGMQRR